MIDRELFERERPRLLALAYQLVGGASDAEDLVQEALLRASQPGLVLEHPGAWLTTVLTRLCIDHSRSARARRETYVGPWLPEPAIIDATFEQRTENAEAVSFAFLVALEALSPLERASYLLHHVFDYSFDEVGVVLGRDPAASRQLAHRAKRHLEAQRPRFTPDREAHAALVQGFAAAVATGDEQALVSLLAPDARCVSDGGGKRKSALKVVSGADRVARMLVGLARRGFGARSLSFESINGAVGIVVRDEVEIDSVTIFESDGARVCAVHLVRNPDKLRFLERQFARRSPTRPGDGT
jgi:RNA polymerase sigma-70 factor, ECF subfamily